MARRFLFLFLMFVFGLGACDQSEETAPSESIGRIADHVLLNGRIYTANKARAFAEALAVKGDEIIFVGSSEGARSLVGDATQVIDLEGKLVLPGFHDTHIHPIGAMDLETCDLENQPLSLEAIAEHVKACVQRFAYEKGSWISVSLWNFAEGNAPGGGFQTIREALDSVSRDHPIVLLGSDGHHMALNSAALGRAKTADGTVIGVTARNLADEFKAYAGYFGVDANGEPDGRITEAPAAALVGAPDLLSADMERHIAEADKLMDVLLPNGITSFMDAAASPDMLALYDRLVEEGTLKARATLSLFLDPDLYRRPDGSVDFDAIMQEASALRRKYEAVPGIKADVLKLFADGVLEGDPLAMPPTLPNAAMLAPYVQPRVRFDPQAKRVVMEGAVDVNAPLCRQARNMLETSAGAQAVTQFIADHGFHPRQCRVSNGMLQYERDVIIDFVRRGVENGFTLHIHAIGDRAVRTALDAIEAAEAEGKAHAFRHIITHLQVIHPRDVPRFSKLGVYASFTYAWILEDEDYDLTVIPFIDEIQDNARLYRTDGYYWNNAYPVAAVLNSGGVLIAGSDAPVDTRDPRPLVNIQTAVTRSAPGGAPLNAAERISILDAIDSYTINGARALHQADITGSLETGKKADFIILSEDIIALADSGQADRISETVVLETWFDGALVYVRPSRQG